MDRRAPDAPARTLLGMVDADPQAALALIGRMAGQGGYVVVGISWGS